MKKFLLFIAIMLSISSLSLFCNVKTANANELTDAIEEQLDKIDLSDIEEYQERLGIDYSILEVIKDMLNGEYKSDYSSFSNYIINIIFNKLKNMLPSLISIVVIVIIFNVVNSIKGSLLSDGIYEIIFYVCFCAIAIILLSQIFIIGEDAKNNIKNLSNLCQIMSPIIISLMIASGGTVSASIYTPAVAFLSGGIISFILSVILPLINLTLIFDVLACSSKVVKIKKYSEFISSVIKWSLGIIITIFSVFISVQGISGNIYDGISMKAAKYLITNSVPIIGNFIGNGFDFIVAGSVLIKNAVGVGGIILILYTILSPIIMLGAYSLLLKLLAAFIDSVSDNRFSDLCISVSKHANYLLAMILLVGFMLLIVFLLMIFSANTVF